MQTAVTQIGKLHLHHAAGQEIATKMRLAAMLDQADLRPVGVSPTAVLIVRHLPDPKPGRVALATTSLRPDTAWETAVRQSLTSFYQRAARPEQGIIPTDAAAVLFADESEMLACLALALARGEARHRWWWQVPLRVLPAHALDALAAILPERAHLIPAALHRLTTWRQAETVLHHLAKPQVEKILGALAAAFELPSLLPTATDPSIPAADTAAALENGRLPGRIASRTQPALPSSPPWLPFVNIYYQPSGLTSSQHYLWGWAISLYTAPGTARQPSFRQAARQWLSRQLNPFIAPLPAPAHSSATDADAVTTLVIRQLDEQETAVPTHKFAHPQQPTRQSAQEPTHTASEQQAANSDQPVKTNELAQSSNVLAIDAAQSNEPLTTQSDSPIQPGKLDDGSPIVFHERESQVEKTAVPAAPTQPITPPSEQMAAPMPTPSDWADGLPTQLAGVFYLINLMQRLHLPHCFDDTWALSKQLSPWALLDLLTRSFIDIIHEDVLTDSLWSALAELNGRSPGTPPSGKFNGPPHYALPDEWLSQTETHKNWFWASNGRFLRIWSEKGFVVCQQPINIKQDAATQAQTWFKQAGLHLRPVLARGNFADAPVTVLDSPLLTGVSIDMTRWLGLVLPFLRYWLHMTLGQFSAGYIDITKEVLRQNGRLYLSSSHVDIVMPLADINLPVRLAGLDFDPGWLPDFGRVVQFHFEQ